MLHTIQDTQIKLREEFRRICPYLIGVQSDSLVTLDGDVVVNGYQTDDNTNSTNQLKLNIGDTCRDPMVLCTYVTYIYGIYK